MAELIHRHWQPADQSGLVAADRRGGRYSAYVPDMLCGRPLASMAPSEHQLPPPNGQSGASPCSPAHVAWRRSPAPHPFGGHLQFDDRRHRTVAAAGGARRTGPDREGPGGLSDKAKLVANNIAVLRTASGELVSSPTITITDIEALHDGLLPDDRHRGIRTVQNWIGGSGGIH